MLYCWRLANIIKYSKYISLAHTQHYLQNAEDNNNSGRDFLLDVDLSHIFLHTSIYPEIITDFTLEDRTL